jgi:large subunit ribosomal protein L35
MPKMKTNRAAAKRFKITAKGKIKRRRANLRHILVNKTRKQKRRLGKATLVDKTNERAIRALLPYGRE